MKIRVTSKTHPEWTKEEIRLLKLILKSESKLCQQYKEKLKPSFHNERMTY